MRQQLWRMTVSVQVSAIRQVSSSVCIPCVYCTVLSSGEILIALAGFAVAGKELQDHLLRQSVHSRMSTLGKTVDASENATPMHHLQRFRRPKDKRVDPMWGSSDLTWEEARGLFEWCPPPLNARDVLITMRGMRRAESRSVAQAEKKRKEGSDPRWGTRMSGGGFLSPVGYGEEHDMSDDGSNDDTE